MARLAQEGALPARWTLHVSVAEREARDDLRDHAPTPSVRARAAAFLRSASGVPPAVTARARMLRPRHPEPVARWLNRRDAKGSASLPIRDGGGRTPACSP